MSEELAEFRFKDIEEYRNFLESKPKDDWIQLRSLGSSQHKFIPLFIQQANADWAFREWTVVEEKLSAIQNGVVSTVTILALPDYPGADYIRLVGSAAILFKSAKNAIEFDVPNASERAIGKALSRLGNVFGRNLNRTFKKGDQKFALPNDFSFNKKSK